MTLKILITGHGSWSPGMGYIKVPKNCSFMRPIGMGKLLLETDCRRLLKGDWKRPYELESSQYSTIPNYGLSALTTSERKGDLEAFDLGVKEKFYNDENILYQQNELIKFLHPTYQHKSLHHFRHKDGSVPIIKSFANLLFRNSNISKNLNSDYLEGTQLMRGDDWTESDRLASRKIYLAEKRRLKREFIGRLQKYRPGYIQSGDTMILYKSLLSNTDGIALVTCPTGTKGVTLETFFRIKANLFRGLAKHFGNIELHWLGCQRLGLKRNHYNKEILNFIETTIDDNKPIWGKKSDINAILKLKASDHSPEFINDYYNKFKVEPTSNIRTVNKDEIESEDILRKSHSVKQLREMLFNT